MPRRPRIYIEGTPLVNAYMSGIGHVLLETINALDRSHYAQDYDIRVFVPFNERGMMERFTFNNIRVINLPIPHKLLSLFARLPFSFPLDLMIGRGFYIFPNFRNWNLFWSRSATYVHDVCFLLHPEFVEPRNLNFLTKYVPMWLHRTDKVVAISSSSRDEIAEHLRVDPGRLRVVRNAVDTARFYPRSAEEVERVRIKYGLEREYFLYLGNIEPRKNLETLIRAYTHTDLKSTTQLFLVGGDGWLNEGVYSAISDACEQGYSVKKNSTYVPDEDLPALMTGALSLVQPSWHEGFGMAVIQAIACRTRSVCSDIPGLRDATIGNDDWVTFFDPADQEDLTKKLNAAVGPQGPTESPVVGEWNQAVESLMTIVKEEMK